MFSVRVWVFPDVSDRELYAIEMDFIRKFDACNNGYNTKSRDARAVAETSYILDFAVEVEADVPVVIASDVSVPRQIDLSDKTTEQLQNRYRVIHMELLRHNSELQQRLLEADALQQSIEAESKKPDEIQDEGWIMAQKKRLTWCQDTTRITYEMARLYQEVSAILQTFAKRDVPVPVGVSIRNGLIPASKAK